MTFLCYLLCSPVTYTLNGVALPGCELSRVGDMLSLSFPLRQFMALIQSQTLDKPLLKELENMNEQKSMVLCMCIVTLLNVMIMLMAFLLLLYSWVLY